MLLSLHATPQQCSYCIWAGQREQQSTLSLSIYAEQKSVICLHVISWQSLLHPMYSPGFLVMDKMVWPFIHLYFHHHVPHSLVTPFALTVVMFCLLSSPWALLPSSVYLCLFRLGLLFAMPVTHWMYYKIKILVRRLEVVSCLVTVSSEYSRGTKINF